ncbi:MAG TPA: hypothetical protein VGN20_16695 [Mucilaginibacter sp.]|jgi:hypothetical protein
MEPIPYFYDSINRSAIIVKAKQPFFDWMNALDPENPVETPTDGTVYLVKFANNNNTVEKWLKRNFDKIFINELNDWWTDEDDWPQKRTYKLFTEWLDTEVQATVLDIEETEIN